ncbi:MAG: hypothetical protein NTX12_08920 [Actinobacteria bacterium]|nr:hypothetical protein [Actinomycetota bacterium]
MNKPTLTLVLAFALIAGAAPSANAADLKVAAQSAVSGFQASLTATLEQMGVLEDEHAKNTADINQVNLDATAKATSSETANLLSVSNLYNPKISASNALITSAKTKWESVNQLVIKDGFGFQGNVQTVAGKYFLCPPSTLPNGPTWLEIVKRNCNGGSNAMLGARSTKGTAGSTIGGEDWQKGDIGTLNTWDLNQAVESVISDGYMVPVNLADFDSTRLTIKNETANLNSLTGIYSRAKAAVMTKYDIAVSVINAATNKALDAEDKRYEQALAALETKQAQSEAFVLAAKRASKDYKSFDKAFSTALAFEYNRAQLTQIVDLPWSAFTTLRSLSSLAKVIALADYADAVAAKYTMANALKLNASVGNTFAKAPTFVAGVKKAKAVYAKVIKS